MGSAFSWLLALRYLRSRWVNVLGVLGVAVAVWAMIVVRCVFSGFVADIRVNVRNSAPDLLVTSLPHDQGYRALRDVLEADDDVVATAPRLRHYGVFYLRLYGRIVMSNEVEFSSVDNNFVQLLGVDPELERHVTPLPAWIDAGRETTSRLGVLRHTPPPLGPRFEVPTRILRRAREAVGLPLPANGDPSWEWPGLLLGWQRTKFLYRSLQVGSPMDVVSVDFAGAAAAGPDGPPATNVQSLQSTFVFAGAFETRARLFDETTALVAIEPLRTMLGHDEWDDASVDIVTDVAVRARDGMTDDELRALAARLQPRVAAALPAGAAAPEILTWEQQNVVFLDAVEVERAMMTIVLFVVMLIAAFLIYATLNMMVTQKVKDIGILSALGGVPRGIGAIFTRCGAVIGLLGGSLGTGLGLLSLHYLNPINDWTYAQFGFELFPRTMFALDAIPYEVDPRWVAGIAVSAFALTLLVSWLPARKAARMHPVQALSYE